MSEGFHHLTCDTAGLVSGDFLQYNLLLSIPYKHSKFQESHEVYDNDVPKQNHMHVKKLRHI